jgi:hypothetical protein
MVTILTKLDMTVDSEGNIRWWLNEAR